MIKEGEAMKIETDVKARRRGFGRLGAPGAVNLGIGPVTWSALRVGTLALLGAGLAGATGTISINFVGAVADLAALFRWPLGP